MNAAHGISIRRGCQAVGLPRSTYRYRPKVRDDTPIIDALKANLGFRRFRLRGLQRVKGELYLMAIAHNLNKLFRIVHARAILLSFARLLGVLRLYRPAYA